MTPQEGGEQKSGDRFQCCAKVSRISRCQNDCLAPLLARKALQPAWKPSDAIRNGEEVGPRSGAEGSGDLKSGALCTMSVSNEFWRF